MKEMNRIESTAGHSSPSSHNSIIRSLDHSIIRLHLKQGFTLVEMLVVIGIIAVLTGALMASYSTVVARAQTARAQELVSNVKTALTQILQSDESWPQALLAEGASGNGQLTPKAGAVLAQRRVMSFSYRERSDDATGETWYELSGPDKFGVLDPWAADVVKRRMKSGSLSLSTEVPTGGTVQDHRLRFAVDDDYDGLVKVSGDGVSATIRASAVVWGAGRDGKFGTKDDIRSWAKGQEVR